MSESQVKRRRYNSARKRHHHHHQKPQHRHATHSPRFSSEWFRKVAPLARQTLSPEQLFWPNHNSMSKTFCCYMQHLLNIILTSYNTPGRKQHDRVHHTDACVGLAMSLGDQRLDSVENATDVSPLENDLLASHASRAWPRRSDEPETTTKSDLTPFHTFHFMECCRQ